MSIQTPKKWIKLNSGISILRPSDREGYVDVSVGGGSGSAAWGDLTGNLSDQTDLQTALDAKESITNKGAVNGYASLDGSGLVPSSQLPSYVDDVLEYANLAAFPGTGSTGKIYIALDTNFVYRWSGSAYIQITSSTVGGSNTHVQFNNNGVLGGTSNVVWDGTSLKVASGKSFAANEYNSTNYNAPIIWQGYTALSYISQPLTGSSATDQFVLTPTWNTSGTPTAIKLNVTNTASNTLSKLIDLQSSTTTRFSVAATGSIFAGTATSFITANDASGTTLVAGASGTTRIRIQEGGYSTYFSRAGNHDWNGLSGIWIFKNESTSNGNTATSGTGAHVVIDGLFKPSSGTAVYADLSIQGTINQTGGANGQVRGIYINPTLTAVGIAYRALESTAGQVKIADATIAVTGSLAGSLLDLTQTWSTSGTPTAIKLNVTDSSSNASSKLIDLQVGGTSFFYVRKDGSLNLNERVTNEGITFGSNNDKGVYASSSVLTLSHFSAVSIRLWDGSAYVADKFRFTTSSANPLLQFGGTSSSFPSLKRNAATLEVRLADDSAYGVFRALQLQAYDSTVTAAISATTGGYNGLTIKNTGIVNWSSTTDATSGSFDVGLKRSAAGNLFVTNGGAGSGDLTAGNLIASGHLEVGSGARIYSQSNDTLLLINAGFTDFNRLNFGGATSSFPALKRSSATIQARLADDSDFAKVNVKQLLVDATNIATGTTGAQTINKASGQVNFAIGDSSLTVTNSLVTTSSLIFAMVQTDADPTVSVVGIKKNNGDFTIILNNNASVETPVAFFVVN